MATLLQPPPTTAEGRQASKIAALEQRVAALERGGALIPVLSAPPSTAAREGAMCTDSGGAKLYVRISGVWRSASLV